MSSFSDLPLAKNLTLVTEELGFEVMTPIQALAIPVLLKGDDVIGQAQTGTGKTAAFGLPLLQKISLGTTAVQALVLCPTRELAQQVARDLRTYGRKLDGLKVLMVCGGLPMRDQTVALAAGVHILVGTPGRVLDHSLRENFDFNELRFLVLDEADRMLEMGFADDLRQLVERMPRARQTALFSATFPEAIATMSRKFLRDPEHLTVVDAAPVVRGIKQISYELTSEPKTGTLVRVLQQHEPKSAIVFCNQKASVAELVETLLETGASVAALSGDLEQRERDRVLALFRNGSVRILVATDVAARGLDIDGLDLVVNYDLPHQAEIYVHRIGRTGRANQAGTAVSLVNPRHDLAKITAIEEATKTPIERGQLGFKNQHGLGNDSALRIAAMRTLSIGGGRKDKLRPGDILGALTAGAITGAQIGKIEIQDHLSYVAVSSAMAEAALQILREGKIKGRKYQARLVKA